MTKVALVFTEKSVVFISPFTSVTLSLDLRERERERERERGGGGGGLREVAGLFEAVFSFVLVKEKLKVSQSVLTPPL